MVINQKFFGADSIFSIITTVVMVFVSIFTAGSAICIAWTQRKNGKRNHLNNLSVEFVTDFIQPLEEYEVSIKNKSYDRCIRKYQCSYGVSLLGTA